MHKYDYKFHSFQDSAWPDRDDWVQVPHGTTDYEFVGDVIIENGNFWLFLHSNPYDCPFMYPNIEGGPGFVSEIYTISQGWHKINHVPVYTKILRNTPDELIVEHAGKKTIDTPDTDAVIVTYRIKKGGGWIEVNPVKNCYKQFHHSSAKRFAFGPSNSGIGNDFVVNTHAIPFGEDNLYPLPSDNNNFILQEIDWSFSDNAMYMITYPDPIAAEPTINARNQGGGDTRIQAIEAFFGGNKVILGVVNQRNVVHHEEVNQHITAGSTYTSSFTPPIPGRWRMSGRVDGEYYTSDVYDGTFTFTSPVSGTLEVLLMYLYDRTSETPADVNTPMGIYRETISGITTGAISGTVTDKDTGLPIPGVKITADGHFTTTE